MAVQAVSFATRVFTYILDMFVTILNSCGLFPFFVYLFTLTAVIAYFLGGLLVNMRTDSSDSDRKRGKK